MGQHSCSVQRLGDSTLISEVDFATNYKSHWRSLTPSMEQYVRRCNLDKYDRIYAPLPSLSGPERRGLINETAFRLYTSILRVGREKSLRDKAVISNSFRAAVSYIYGSHDISVSDLDSVERREVVVLAGRMEVFFLGRSNGTSIIASPLFKGSGIVDACHGDILIGGGSIWEIKAGDRQLRSIDFRQLTVYSALHYASTNVVPARIGVFNPRTGIALQTDMDTYCMAVSGLAPAELLYRLIALFSGHMVSA